MGDIQVIACFVIYCEERIVHQRTLQVSESPNSVLYPSTDGSEFAFIHSYQGNECKVELSCSNNGSTVATCQLTMPVNRTKLKWKNTKLGKPYEVYYRCAFEDWNSKKMIKQLNKQRGMAITRGNNQACGSIYSEGDSSSDGNGSGST